MIRVRSSRLALVDVCVWLRDLALVFSGEQREGWVYHFVCLAGDFVGLRIIDQSLYRKSVYGRQPTLVS